MTFDDLNLNKQLRNALSAMNLTEPTPIQARVFPVAMSGRDVLGIAQTGTGKTIGYLLPSIMQWRYTKNNEPQILILVPTRELVVQVLDVAKQLSVGSNIKCVGVFGGVGMQPQAEAVAQGADILISTPGRLLDLVLNGCASMKGIRRLIVDEVDEMLELGFRTQLGRVFDLLPRKRQNLLFSATMTDEIAKLTDVYFNGPERIEAAPVGTPLENITQTKFQVPNYNTKLNLLRRLLRDKELMTSVLVFVGSMALADRVFDAIKAEFDGEIDYIHSKRTQSQRFGAMRAFAERRIRILIATDVVARGIDISDVSHVVNFDLPGEPEQYIHRIGRTGRADKKGSAIMFCSPAEEEKCDEIEQLMQMKIDVAIFPDDVEVSTILTDFEQPTYRMKNTLIKTDATPGSAFHERAEKNRKVNVRVSHAEQMRRKYGKPITRKPKRK